MRIRVAQPTAAAIGERDWELDRRRRERLHRAEARTTRTSSTAARYGGYLHARRPPHAASAAPSTSGRTTRWARAPRRLNVPLPVELPDLLLAARPRRCSTPAANVLFQSADEGQSWEAISPDLTRNDPTKLRPVRRADHQGQHRRRVLLHDLRGRRVARSSPACSGAARDDGLRARHARRRRDLERRDAAATCPSGRRSTASRPHPLRAGRRYVAGDALQARRLPSRTSIAPTDYGGPGRRSTAGIDREHFTRAMRADPARAGAALRRHRARRLRLASTTARAGSRCSSTCRSCRSPTSR